MKDFEVYNWWTLQPPLSFAQIVCMIDGTSVWAWDDDAEGHFKKQLFGPLQHFKALTPEGKPFEGIRA